MSVRTLAAAVMMIAIGWGAGSAPAQAALAPGDADSGYYLRLSGSNTIGSALAPALVKAWLGQQGAEEIFVVQRKDANGNPKDEWEVHARRGATPITVEIKFHGSPTGFQDLASGSADVAMASRRIKPAEAERLGGFDSMTSEASEYVIGLDGISIIVPRTNNVFFLSTKVLEDVFCGRVRNWSALGGPNLPISLYARDDKSGTTDMFAALVLKTCKLDPSTRRYEDSSRLEEDVSQDAGGIGFVAFPFVKNTRAVPISDGDAEPLEPTRFTIKKEDYVLTRRLFLYAQGIPANRHAREFINFALSDAGQEIVRMNNFVDLTIGPHPKTGYSEEATGRSCQLSPQWTGDPQKYCRLHKQTLLTVVYFNTNSTAIDNRAKFDLRRRIFNAIDANPGSALILAGFADSQGGYWPNCRLSLRRAEAVGSELRSLGIGHTRSVGFCPEQPVRDNDTEEGREKNRRVEIYLADPGFDPGSALPPSSPIVPVRPIPPSPIVRPTPGPHPASNSDGHRTTSPPLPPPPSRCNFFQRFTVGCDNAASGH